MCTVSFIPINKKHFILTSNRDETVERGLASAPTVIDKINYKLICPVDPLANGTWIAASDFGDVVCLLNGAFKKHKHQPPYRMSRGIVVLDYFREGNPEKFATNYNLENIEPFTMVIIHQMDSIELFELRWDGKETFFTKLNEDEFHLWSSATLYSEDVAHEKFSAFRKTLDEHEEISSEKMIAIHQQFLYEDWVKPPARVMEVATLSVTSVESNSSELTMHYRDLVRSELPPESLSFNLKP